MDVGNLLLLRLKSLLEDAALLLLGEHELEAVEVGHLGAVLLDGDLLGPAGGVPLALEVALGHGLLQTLLAGTTHDVALEVGEAQPADGDLLTLDAGVGTVDENLETKLIQTKY